MLRFIKPLLKLTFDHGKLVSNFASFNKNLRDNIEGSSRKNIQNLSTMTKFKEEQNDFAMSDVINNEQTIKTLNKKGIIQLFPIQIRCYQQIFNGKDILASDRTGSGKTIAYVLPILQKARLNQWFQNSLKQKKSPCFLILCPTRQLTLQVTNEINTLKNYSQEFEVLGIYGGTSINAQIYALRKGVDIVVATPGRLMDLIERQQLKLSNLKVICIDQADQMLEKGFNQDIQQIFEIISSQVQSKTQNLMFSATIPGWVHKISSNYLSPSAFKLNLVNKLETKTPTTVQHFAVECSKMDRIQTVSNLIQLYNPSGRTLIFVSRKVDVQQYISAFKRYQSCALHGDITQSQRESNLNMFRRKQVKILVATDVAARGLDIPDVELVIQVEPSQNLQSYIHRSGRTGRAGKKGISILLYNKDCQYELGRIQDFANINFRQIVHGFTQNTTQKILQNLKNVDSYSSKKYSSISKKILSYYDPQTALNMLLLCYGPRLPKMASLLTGKHNLVTYEVQISTEEDQNVLDKVQMSIKQNFPDLNLLNMQIKNEKVYFDLSLTNFYQLGQQLTQIKDSSLTIRITQNFEYISPVKQQQEEQIQTNTKIIITNIYNQTTQQELREILHSKGVMFKFWAMKRSKNPDIEKNDYDMFAIVECNDQYSTRKLLKLHCSLFGRKLKIKQARGY